MEGSTDWTYEWYKDGRKVQADNDVSFDSDATTLSINSASALHSGQYKCFGKLKSRSVDSVFSSERTLYVYGEIIFSNTVPWWNIFIQMFYLDCCHIGIGEVRFKRNGLTFFDFLAEGQLEERYHSLTCPLWCEALV